MAVLASGAGSTLSALVAAHQAGALGPKITLVITSRAESEATTVALRHGIAQVTLDERALGHEAVDEAMLRALDGHETDLVVLTGYTRRVGQRTLAAYSRRVLNLHPAPLPRFGGKGMYGDDVHRAVLESGLSESAAIVHLVDGEYDTGPVIATRGVPLEPDDDVTTLRARVQIAERALLVQTLNDWVKPGSDPTTPRSAFGNDELGDGGPASLPPTPPRVMSAEAVA